LKKLIARLVFFLGGGWKMKYDIPKDIKKCVVVAAPHTSNWDFIYGLAGLWILGNNLKYLIKKEVFVPPLSWFLKWSGGIPVDRTQKNNLTEELVSVLEKNDELFLLFPAEGTRSYVKKWKTGFYRVAVDTDLPLVLGYLDFEKKEGGYGAWLMPTGDMEADFKKIEEFYKDKKGKHPEKYNPQIFERE